MTAYFTFTTPSTSPSGTMMTPKNSSAGAMSSNSQKYGSPISPIRP